LHGTSCYIDGILTLLAKTPRNYTDHCKSMKNNSAETKIKTEDNEQFCSENFLFFSLFVAKK